MTIKRTMMRLLSVAALVATGGCSRDVPGTAPDDLEGFARDYTAAWCSQDAASVAAFFAEDGSLRINDGEPSVGRAAITEAAQGFMTDFPDMVVRMDSLGRSGDRVTYHWTLTGTNTGPDGTGRAVMISGFEEWRFGPDGRIADSRGHFDGAEYQRQLAQGGPLPQWEFDPAMVFPEDRSLARPEDGVALPDGSLVVADQAHGLRRVRPDGSSEPFGEMAAAGYIHRPPERAGGANGVSLEPSGTHVLVADIHHGGIYRLELATGATERVHQHRYGVNTAVRDSRGAIWFTQSAWNTPEEGEARMWAAVDVPSPEGALLRLGVDRDGRLAEAAEVLVDSLYYANGLAIDEESGHLYLAETMGGRVRRYRADLDAGRLDEPEVLVDDLFPDNLELDEEGRLWIAAPLTNELVVLDLATGARHSAFRSVTPAQLEVVAEMARRIEQGTPLLELFTPDSWAPLPGAVTGIILGRGDGPSYITGLGNALVKLDR
ncbi:MAG: SMP-30/gluconolactonase/LRE family protein [Gemmatimonadota bacterium]